MGESENSGPASRQGDGIIDFSHYSDAQLRELQTSIDETRFPKNFSNLMEELKRREACGPLSAKVFGIRFTPADGVLGWLQAKLARQKLYGGGEIEITDKEVELRGWQRTWLGTAHQGGISIPMSSVLNAYCDRDRLEFESRINWVWRRRYAFRAPDPKTILLQLPTRKSKRFERQAENVWEFHRLLRSTDRRAIVTPAIVVINLAIYAAMAIATRAPFALDGSALMAWGANYGPLTATDQWWRLLSAAFLHMNLLHIGINMWVLWSAGRFTEKLYGSTSFLAIYMIAAVSSSLASIAWNPVIYSVGASGAIFGVLGALLAYLAHGGTKVPLPMMRAYFIPTALFAAFSIGNGLLQSGIDNAAHVGGLLSGFLLGWAVARPLQGNANSGSLLGQSTTAIMLFGVELLVLLAYVRDDAGRPGPREGFLQSRKWYVDGETKNLQLWQELAARAGNGTASSADLNYQFQKNILPFWQTAAPRLHSDLAKLPPDQKPFGATLAEFADLRRRWAQALIEATASTNGEASQKAVDLMQKTDLAQARLERLGTRESFDRSTRSLAESAPVTSLENALWFGRWKCVKYPFDQTNPVAVTDSPTDGPARGESLACQAQHLFLIRDFAALEALLNHAAAHLADLPDGGSSLGDLVSGLGTLMSFGGLSPEQMLDRTAQWRRMTPGSVQAEIAEAMVFEAWGYAARGYGAANTISAQNLMFFTHRIEMAAAGLRAVAPRAVSNPVWYQEAIYLGLYQSLGEETLRHIFDNGRRRFPDYLPLYGAMLHALMPRWGGSYEKVGQFIAQQSTLGITNPNDAYKKYARLYWIYSSDEGDDLDIFKEAGARWEGMDLGFGLLMKQYPNSDYIRNAWGKFSCMAGDRLEYLTFHSRLPQRYSASAWSNKISVDSCNKKFSLK